MMKKVKINFIGCAVFSVLSILLGLLARQYIAFTKFGIAGVFALVGAVIFFLEAKETEDEFEQTRFCIMLNLMFMLIAVMFVSSALYILNCMYWNSEVFFTVLKWGSIALYVLAACIMLWRMHRNGFILFRGKK